MHGCCRAFRLVPRDAPRDASRTILRGAAAFVILAVAGSAIRPAIAQDRPVFPPSRDVAVTYRVEKGDQHMRIRLTWSAGLRALRAEALAGAPASLGGVPLPPGARLIVDRRAGRAFAVEDSTGLLLDLPRLANQAEAAERALASTQARREGVDRVANLPCTVWRLQPPANAPTRRPMRVCLTTEGVPLRAQEEGRSDRAEAITVRYGPQDAALFRPPQGGLAGNAGSALGRVLGGLLRGGQTGAGAP